MGAALYISLEKPVAGFDTTSISGKALEKAQAQLDGFARKLGLTPLADFISTDPEEAAAFLEDEGGIPEGLTIPAEEWFDASDGLRTVQGLLDVIRRDPERLRNVIVDHVRVDLEAAEAILAAAKDAGVRFHLAVDF